MASLNIELTGGKQLYELGRRLKTAPRRVQDASRRELRRAVEPLQDAIRAEVEPTMPKGYEPVLLSSLKFKVQINARYFSSVTLTTTAGGKAKKREIRALDKGLLRHPVYGRFRVSHRTRSFIPNPWVAQKVRPGFWSRPVREAAPRIRRELVRVIADELHKH